MKHARSVTILASVALASLPGAGGCTRASEGMTAVDGTQDVKSTQEEKAPERSSGFSGRRAHALVEAFIKIAPRVPDTPGSVRARAFIRAALEKIGLASREESFRMETIRGQKTFVNVLATIEGEEPGRIVWGAHYDTPDFELDPDYVREYGDKPFPGANDGGSGVAVLLELARVLAARGKPRLTQQFLFLDGEEKIGTGYFTPYLDDPSSNACFGARGQALQWKEDPPHAFVLLDMVGDRDLNIAHESSYSAERLVELFKRAARIAGHESHFFKSERGLVDDHVPFSQLDVPTIDLIDFDYGPRDSRGKGAYWHTPLDTLDKISARSLQIVGEVCLAALPLLEKEFD